MLVAILIAAVTVHASASAQTGPVASYAFNETSGTTAADGSGNGIVGTLTNGAVFAAGKNGNAVSLDGTNDFVNLGNPTALRLTGSMTISGWINSTSFPFDDAAVVSKRSGAQAGYQLDTTIDRGPRTIGFKISNTTGTSNVARYGATTLQANTWYHVAGVYDATARTLTVYLNGQLDNGALVGTVPASQPSTSVNVQVGQRPGAPGTYNFTGRIDDVRIYNRALTLAQIQADMGTPVGPPAPNTPPTISAIANQTTNEDTVTGAIPFTVGDAETPLGSLTVSGGSSNPGLVPTGNIAFGGSGASRTVTITPAANQSGSATITVTVSDGQLTASTTFQVTVTAVNDAPTITTIVNQTTTSGTAVGPLSFTVGDVETASGSLTVSGGSSNPTLVPPSNITFGGSGASRTVTVTPAAGQTGVATITVTVDDGQASASTAFQLTVTGANTAPTITSIADLTINEDTASGALSFTVGDAETPPGSLTVSGGSSNLALVPTANIAFGGAGASRTVTITPAANQSGSATITVTVSDGQLTASTAFQVTVTAVNDAPTITTIANQTTTSGTAVGPLSFTVGDVETAPGSLTVSGGSSNPTLVPPSNITFGGSGASRTVTVTPVAGQTGVATITVGVSDGQANTTTSFQLTVTSAPTGVAAAYAFDELSGTTTADASGNANTGTLTNGAAFGAGRNGNAVTLDGVNDFVNVGNGAALRLTGSMTISAWINATGFPFDDAAVVSKRTGGDSGYQLDTTIDRGPRTVGFKISDAAGTSNVARYGATTLQVNTWYHVAGVYNASAQTLTVYVNGQLDNGALVGTVPASQPSTSVNVNIGQRPGIPGTFNFSGRIDDARIYGRALTQAEIQADMATPVGGSPPTDTTPPTVVITAPTAGSTVTGMVSVVADASDNVGIAGVQFQLDGQALGAEVTSSPYSVVWNTGATSSGSHVLTAVARDLAGNTTSSAPVSVTVSSATPDLVGQWAAPGAWPLVAVHAHLLATGEVLASSGQNLGSTARLWNPTTNVFTSVDVTTGTNIFCAGHCHLVDGRVIVAGGHVNVSHVGITDTNIFDPATRQWTRVAPMHTPRWYPTLTTLANGRILVTAGEINCDACNALLPEVYDPVANTWTELSSAPLSFPYYPHMFVLPDGRVLAASATEESIISRALDVAAQTWSVVDPVPVDGGSAAMFLPGKVMKSGTSTNPDEPVVPAAATTYVLDATQPSPTWRQTASMSFPRAYHTLTILPDGNVLVTGGGPTTDAIGLNNAIKAAELWSPTTETWTTMASMQTPRLYHSTALLLPDARVLVAGGGRWTGSSPDPSDQLSAEIYSPPYLFRGARPVIGSAPAQMGYGGSITIQTPDAARIGAVALIKLGSVTHAFDMDQRFVPLSFTWGSDSLSVQTPLSANLAPPGDYMLFIVDTAGIPSVAAIVKVQ